ncbi:hypothetical protein STANM309S_04314 [Streptomyces tanashiensis]
MTDGSAGEFSVADSLPGTALGYYRALEPTGPRKLVVVDIATARVVQEFTAAAGATLGGAATITQDSVEWTEDLNGTTVLASAKRGSSEVTRVPLTADVPPRFLGALGGDWSVFGDRGATAEPRGVVARGSRTVGDSYFEPTWMRDTLSDTAVARNHDRDLVIDLKTGQQVGTYQPAPEPDWPKPYVPRSSFLSPTHVGWTERTDDKLVLATAVRDMDQVVRTPLGPDDSTTITGGLLGDLVPVGRHHRQRHPGRCSGRSRTGRR